VGAVLIPATILVSLCITDGDLAVHVLDTSGGARNGFGLVGRFFASGGARQPHDAVLIGVDMNAFQAGEMLRGELGLDLSGNGRILHEGHCVGTCGVQIIVGHDRSGTEERSANYTGCNKSRFHDISALNDPLPSYHMLYFDSVR